MFDIDHIFIIKNKQTNNINGSKIRRKKKLLKLNYIVYYFYILRLYIKIKYINPFIKYYFISLFYMILISK